MSSSSRRNLLLQRAQAFCSAFLDLPNNPPTKILEEHFTSSDPKVTEHGPTWASTRLPFLGRTFTGRDQFLEYFDLLSQTLEFIPDVETFPRSAAGFVVDEYAEAQGVVSVVGKAKFRAINNGKAWSEQFIYRLSGFDEDGKIGHWEVWADPLSAWTAVGGD